MNDVRPANDVFLLPGRLAVMSGSGVIRTVLGSCVAVVLYDPVKMVAGVNHYLLPAPPAAYDEKSRLKYGSFAIPALIDALLEKGASIHRLCAELYGGAAVVDQLVGNFSIGDNNIRTAQEQLELLNIPVVNHDLGGSYGRKIAFYMPGCETQIDYIHQMATGS